MNPLYSVELNKGINPSIIKIFDGGHMIMLEKPKQINLEMMRFFG